MPLIKPASMQLNDALEASLQKSLITEGPGLVLVVDSQSLTVAAFVSGEPERMDPSSYFLVDVFPSSNGVRGHETPQGIFKLLSSRMKEKIFPEPTGVPLNYTMFWQDLNTKSVSGVAFHAARGGREKSIGVECASAGCVNLSGKKAESLSVRL
ncbi:MAG: L,D-transpeptidase [Bdellovibrionaceae bacterium]|nr:L,D-transpeptidase [Pseudobdellovibrionaceae bacterium]